MAYRLPKEAAPAFPPLLRELEQRLEQLGAASYGLSVTTLEEVFLRVSESAALAAAAANGSMAGEDGEAAAGHGKMAAALQAGAGAGEAPAEEQSEFVVVNLPRHAYLRVSQQDLLCVYTCAAAAQEARPHLLLITNLRLSPCHSYRAARCGGSRCMRCCASARCARRATRGRRSCRWPCPCCWCCWRCGGNHVSTAFPQQPALPLDR